MCVGLIVGEENDDDDDEPIYVRDVSDRFALKMPYFSKDLTHSVPSMSPPIGEWNLMGVDDYEWNENLPRNISSLRSLL